MNDQRTYPVLDLNGERRVVGQGMTTDAPTGLPAFQDPVKEFMCVVMCACRKIYQDDGEVPETLTDGETASPEAVVAVTETPEEAVAETRRMQQNCVSGLFQTLDAAIDYKSWVKAEVYYDMQGYKARFRAIGDRTPAWPQPLMSRNNVTKALSWHWGVISHVGRRKNAQLSSPVFVRGGRSLRRPDVVLVRNPAMPPESFNIAKIYELKFDEPRDERQEEAYRDIVQGDFSRVETIEVKDCRCEKRKERIRQMTHAELMAWAAAVSAALAANDKNQRGGGMSPGTVSNGLAIVGALAVGALVVAALPEAAVAAVGIFMLRMLTVGGAAIAANR